jgi:hypothetical protein
VVVVEALDGSGADAMVDMTLAEAKQLHLRLTALLLYADGDH